MGNQSPKVIIQYNAVFKPFNDFKKIKQKQTNEQFKSKQLKIKKNQYQKQDWKSIFKQMISCSFDKINLSWNKHSNIIIEISQIDFKKLKSLDLSGNCINNIQILYLIKSEKLQELVLSNNHISRIDSLPKLLNCGIAKLTLFLNPINNLNCLPKINFNKKYVKHIQLKYFKNQVQIGEDFSRIAKINCKNLHLLKIHQKIRTMQYKVQLLTQKRFLKIQILSF